MVQIHSPRPLIPGPTRKHGLPRCRVAQSCNENTIEKTERGRGPSLRSGFRLRARTPAKRLKFKSTRPDHFHP